MYVMSEHYQTHVNGSNLPASLKLVLSQREASEDAYSDLLHFLEHEAYYTILDKIERGYTWVEQQEDELQKKKGMAKIHKYAEELERLEPDYMHIRELYKQSELPGTMYPSLQNVAG